MKPPFPAQPRSRRGVATLASAVALTALTSACAINNPVQTDIPYVPADGVQTNLGAVAIRDLVLVKSDDVAVVSGSLTNTGGDRVTIQLEPTDGSGSTQLQLQPREQVNLANEGLELTGVAVEAGHLAEVRVSSSDAGATVLKVPVMLPQLYYSTVTPAPATSSDTASPTSTTETPAPASTTETPAPTSTS